MRPVDTFVMLSAFKLRACSTYPYVGIIQIR